MKKILVLVIILVTPFLYKEFFPKRDFVLTQNNGVIYSKLTENLAIKGTPTDDPRKYFEDKSLKYKSYYNENIGFSFLYPKDLKPSQTSLLGFEEYFTLSPILAQEIFSYPGRLSNPETTEKYYSFSIRMIVFNGSLINTETWFEQFQDQKILTKQHIKINKAEWIEYQKSYDQNFNTTLMTSNNNKIIVFFLSAKDKTSYQISEDMLQIIMETFKWL